LQFEQWHLWNSSVLIPRPLSLTYVPMLHFPSNKDLSTWFPLILLIFVISLKLELLLLLWALELLLFYWRFVSKCQQHRMSTTKITETKRSWSFEVDCAVVSSFPLFPFAFLFVLFFTLLFFFALEQIKCLLKKLQTCIAAWKFQMCISGAALAFGCFVTRNLLQSRLRPDTNTFKNVPTYVSRLLRSLPYIFSGNSVDRSLLVRCQLHLDHEYGVVNL